MRGVARARWEVNRRYVRHLVARQRRRDRSEVPLVLPRHWSGSVQQFYHFLLGYLGPAAVWAQRTGTRSFEVRDCGPMNVWFEAIRPEVRVEVVSVSWALELVVKDPRRLHVVQGLDDPLEFQTAKLRSVATAMRWLLDAGDSAPVGGDRPEIVVVDRSTSEDFYRGPRSETDMSGSERRSTPGLAGAIAAIPLVGPSRVVDTARIPPAEQLRLFSGASTIIGQHGAGLVHMLWLPAGSTVVEIVPPLVPGVDHIFRELAVMLGHRYVVVPQASAHAPLDPDALRAGLVAAGVVR